MNATSHPRKRSVERAGLGVLVTGRCHASAVTARIERRSAAGLVGEDEERGDQGGRDRPASRSL